MKGYIYCLHKTDNQKPLYIGSTFDMKARLSAHKSRCFNDKINSPIYKHIRTFCDDVIDWDEDIVMEQIDTIETDCKREIVLLENVWIQKIGLDKLYNNNIARFDGTKQEYDKEYYKEYYIKNRKKLCEYSKEYYINNLKKKREYNKEYYNIHKDYNNEKVLCKSCGVYGSRQNILSHNRTKKHIKNSNN